MRQYKPLTIPFSEITPKAGGGCPFCKYHATILVTIEVDTWRINPKKGTPMQIECTNCGARGPIYGDRESALSAWTNRDDGGLTKPEEKKNGTL